MFGWKTALTLGLMAASALAAPASAQKVLKVVPHADLRVLDGYQTTATITAMHMAETWSMSPDKLKYTYTLRACLKVHDGSPVMTKAVVASVKRLLARETLGRTLEPFVASVDRVDDKTFTISMKEPFGFPNFTLSGVNVAAGIMREKEASIDPATPVTETIGSGPFRFVREEWQPGAKVVYAKNPDDVPRSEPPSGFAGGKVVKIDRVEYRLIPDAASAYAALSKGEVDLLDQPSLDLVPTIANNPDIRISSLFTAGAYGLLRPNHLLPPFNNVKARQALALMVDQCGYAAASFGDERFWKDTTPCFSLWVCGGPFGTQAGSEPYRKQDLEKAKQLLAEAG